MRVSVYKLEDGTMTALVQSSPGKGRAPVLVQGVSSENMAEKILSVVTTMKGPRTTQEPLRF